jgi:hypothetical protein
MVLFILYIEGRYFPYTKKAQYLNPQYNWLDYITAVSAFSSLSLRTFYTTSGKSWGTYYGLIHSGKSEIHRDKYDILVILYVQMFMYMNNDPSRYSAAGLLVSPDQVVTGKSQRRIKKSQG